MFLFARHDAKISFMPHYRITRLKNNMKLHDQRELKFSLCLFILTHIYSGYFASASHSFINWWFLMPHFWGHHRCISTPTSCFCSVLRTSSSWVSHIMCIFPTFSLFLTLSGCQDSCCPHLLSAVDPYWPCGLQQTSPSVHKVSKLYMKVRHRVRTHVHEWCLREKRRHAKRRTSL